MTDIVKRLRSSDVSSQDIREAADVIEQWRELLKQQHAVIVAATKAVHTLLRLELEDEAEDD